MKTVRELMGESWWAHLSHVTGMPATLALGAKLMQEKEITPVWDNVFKAYELTPPEKLKVLILGQDPYPTPGQAHGLAFSSGNGIRPYSLDKIFRDLELCTGTMRSSSDLTMWAKQGVMLLNTCLTTRPKETFAHKGWGWEYIIKETLKVINGLPQRYVVFAWGKAAQEMIDASITPSHRRLILKAPHPANERYAPGCFVGSKHFETANEYFKAFNITPVDWIKTTD